MSTESKNIFVVGADDFNCRLLDEIHNARGYRFHNLLTFDDVKAGGHYPSFDHLLRRAESILSAFDGTIDAIVGYWDFPVNSMVPLLCRHHGLPSPSLTSELKCDHKFWSRTEQQQVIPEHTPVFALFDPFATEPKQPVNIDFPFWLKPIKSTDSFLAFKIRDQNELQSALDKIRANIDRIALPFNELLAHARLPEEISRIDGRYCIAEEMITGQQCTVEGHVYQGEVIAHGVIDSHNYPGTSSFFRYEYPSQLPAGVQQDMIETSRRIMSHIGFDNGCFNIEYFYDPAQLNFQLLEINPRISQSHSQMFKFVDGESNHNIMVEIALGERPRFVPGGGQFNNAAKFHLRYFEDAYVTRVPSDKEVAAITSSMPGCNIDIIVKQDMWLSDLIEQDSYSYDVAHIHIGAGDPQDLLQKYQTVVAALPFEFA